MLPTVPNAVNPLLRHQTANYTMPSYLVAVSIRIDHTMEYHQALDPPDPPFGGPEPGHGIICAVDGGHEPPSIGPDSVTLCGGPAVAAHIAVLLLAAMMDNQVTLRPPAIWTAVVHDFVTLLVAKQWWSSHCYPLAS